MTTAAPSAALAAIQPAFTDSGRIALAGYRGLTREAYALDPRQLTSWRRTRSLPVLPVRRVGIEGPAGELEARSRVRATVTRRLCTIAGSCKYAVGEELLDQSPAAHVRRPRLDYESHATALDRNELGALLVAAGLGPPPAARACADRAARAERAAGLGGHRRRHRAPGPGAPPPDCGRARMIMSGPWPTAVGRLIAAGRAALPGEL